MPKLYALSKGVMHSTSRHACVIVTQRQAATFPATVSRNCFGTGTSATEFERTFVCWFGVGVGNILCARYFADSNTFDCDAAKEIVHPDDGGGADVFCLQR